MTFQPADRVRHLGATIFAEMTALAEAHQAINLGQGFPDFAAPAFLKDAAQAAVAADINQYAPSPGRPRLRQAIAAKMGAHYGLDYDPAREVVVTHGATEALFGAILGLINPGDEVVLFEPTYDSYVPAVQMAGGVPRHYTLRPPDWSLDLHTLASLFSARTRLVILNTPHNPTGKVFTVPEMAAIGALCHRFDAIILADEVYEHIVFPPNRHVPIASLPGLKERTLTVSSLGKTFSVTGWKVGWAVGPEPLLRGLMRAHQFMTFCGAAPLQEAAAVGLEQAAQRGFYGALAADYGMRRDRLVGALADCGLRPIAPQGTYFVLAQIGGLGMGDDVAFCRHLTTTIGVAAIPPSAFYHRPADGSGLARFAFCKSDETLVEAARRLRAGIDISPDARS